MSQLFIDDILETFNMMAGSLWVEQFPLESLYNIFNE